MGSASRAVAPEIVVAVERLVRGTDIDLALIAATAGVTRKAVTGWTHDGGWARALAVRTRSADDIVADLLALGRRANRMAADVFLDGADLPALRRRLRLHIGQQIAAFDAALRGEGAAVIDSARVLRDLGGLKRLLDDLATKGEGDAGRIPEPSDLDLPVLRAEIARRYGGLPGERSDAGVPGKPAGAAAAGAGA